MNRALASWSPGAVDERRLEALASALGARLDGPLTLYLQGELGAGKTTFARALLRGAGYAGRVKSPTYGLLEHYELPQFDCLHLDLYRIADPGEVDFLGIADLLSERTVLLVEWAERGHGHLPPPDLVVALEHAGDHRRLSINTYSSSGDAFLSRAISESFF